MSSIQELFKEAQACRQEIAAVRDAIGKRDATDEVFQCAFQSLALMLIHCPAEMVSVVRAQLDETNTRYAYAMLLEGFFQEKTV